MQVGSCCIVAQPPAPFAPLAGRNVAMFTSTDGGLDATWHAAVASHSMAMPGGGLVRFLAPAAATCVRTTAPNTIDTYNCTGTQMQRPVVGVGEIEGDAVQGLNTVNGGGQPVSRSTFGFTEAPLMQRLYGVAVSLPLYRAMQRAQGLPANDVEQSRPSISRALALTYLYGTTGGIDWGWLTGGTDTQRGSQWNVCRSRSGAGVQAAANAFLGQLPCNASALAPADASWSDRPELGIEGIGDTAGGVQVVEGTVEREVEQCLATAGERSAYAIGVVSLGRFATDLTGSSHRFLRLDGAAPNRELAKTGRYTFMSQVTMRWNNDAVAALPAPLRALIVNYPALQSDPALLGQPGSWREGWMVPVSGPRPFGTGSSANRLMVSAIAAQPMCTPPALTAT